MNTIETALSTSGLAVQAQACLASLSQGQLGPLFSSPDAFRIEYGGGVWTGSLASFPAWGGLTGPTGQPTHAFGFLQFEPGTYEQTAAVTGLTDVEPLSQIVNGWTLAMAVFLSKTGTPLLVRLISGSLADLAAVNNALASTWPSIPRFDFSATYNAELAVLSAAAQPPPVTAPPPTAPPPTAPMPSTPYTVSIAGGGISIADPSTCSAAMSGPGQITIVPIAVGRTTVTYAVTFPVVVKALLTVGPDDG